MNPPARAATRQWVGHAADIAARAATGDLIAVKQLAIITGNGMYLPAEPRPTDLR